MVDKKKKARGKNKVNDNRLYCICQQPFDESQIMVSCDTCQRRFHRHCIGLQSAVKHYYCDACQAKPTDPSPLKNIHRKGNKKRTPPESSSKKSKQQKREPIPVDTYLDIDQTAQDDDDFDDLCPICEFECTCAKEEVVLVNEEKVELLDDDQISLAGSERNMSDDEEDDQAGLTKDDLSDISDSMEEDESSTSDRTEDEDEEEHTFYRQSSGLWATSEEDDDDENDAMAFYSIEGPSQPSDPHVLKPFNLATFDLASNADTAHLTSAPTSPIHQPIGDIFRRLSLPSSTIVHDSEWNDLMMLPVDPPTTTTTYADPSPPKFAFSLPPPSPPAPLQVTSTPASPVASTSFQSKYDLASLLPANIKIPDQLLNMIKASLEQDGSSSSDMVPMEELLDISKLDTRPDLPGHVPPDLSRWERVPIGAFRLTRSKNRRWLNR